MEDIARRCRVSKAAVSLALRNHPRISAETRQRVQSCAAQLGYRTNPLVSAHATFVRTTRRTTNLTVLAYVNNWTASATTESKMVNHQYIQGARKRAEELGYRLEEFKIQEPTISEKRLSTILTSRGILGVIIGDLSAANPTLDLNWDTFAAVSLGCGLRSPYLNRVCHDHYVSCRTLHYHLAKLGYRRIGLAMELRQDERTANLTLAGHLAHLHTQDFKGKPVPPLLIRDWNKQNFLSWYERHKPEVVVSVLDDALRWLREEGVSVPKQVGYASVCCLVNGVSGIHQHIDEIGATAVDQLATQLYHNQRGLPLHPHASLIEGTWLPGRTLRQVR